MLKGRLGLQSAQVPHADRHGLMWLGRGNLYVESGTLRFVTSGWGDLDSGDYAIPFQMVSCFLMAPGTTVSHDALRLLARHGTGLVFIGEGSVRFYASMPFGPDNSRIARRQAMAWADPDQRIQVVQQMYAWRFGGELPSTDLDTLRGMEGSRMKQTYKRLAQAYGIPWRGRRYDRFDPQSNDVANQAINHASSAVEGAALTAVAVAGALPQLGFIHEDPGHAFALDIADLFRDDILLPIAFSATQAVLRHSEEAIEQAVRKRAGKTLRQEKAIPQMIDRIKEVLPDDDDHRDA